LAGEGSINERGLRPLSKISPPLKHNAFGSSYMPLFERGTQGVSIGQQPNANGTDFRVSRKDILWYPDGDMTALLRYTTNKEGGRAPFSISVLYASAYPL
jgi:hypothetical protein